MVNKDLTYYNYTLISLTFSNTCIKTIILIHLGYPALYSAAISFTENGDESASDTVYWRIGFRNISSVVDDKLGGRIFFVNGQRIYLEGGNFISTV